MSDQPQTPNAPQDPQQPQNPQQPQPGNQGYGQPYGQPGQSPGGYPPQGGYGYQQGGYPQGGYQQHGHHPQGGYQQYGHHPQGGYQQYGHHPQGGYQGGGGPPQEMRSKSTIVAIVLGALAVLVLGGLAFAFLGGGNEVSNPPISASPTPSPTEEPTQEPTEEPATEEPATEEPATEEPATEEPATEEPATDEPATEEPTTEEPAGAIPIGNGLSVVPAEGWSVEEQTDTSVMLTDVVGRVFLLNSGTTVHPPSEVAEMVDSLAEGSTNVRRSEVATHDVHPSLVVASQAAAMTVTGGSGSAEMGVFALISSRTADYMGFAGILIAPAEDLNNETVTSAVDDMLFSVMETQVG